MVTKAQVLEAAQRMVKQENIVNEMGKMNTPFEFEKRIDTEVQFRLAQDRMYKLRTEYRNLFEEWYQAGAPE